MINLFSHVFRNDNINLYEECLGVGMTYSVVWFKKDLRLFDHQPFLAASAKGPILCLYVLEPSVWQQPDASHSHYLFLRECLRDLAISLRAYSVRLELAIGEATAVFKQLYNDAPFHSLYSHEETGNFHSYQRDIAVGLWCQQHQVRWHQFCQTGVVRRLSSRDNWQKHWRQRMNAPLLETPTLAPLVAQRYPESMRWPEPMTFGLVDPLPNVRQHGGRSQALSVLNDFLDSRSGEYRGGISSPLKAPTACSRISPYLTYGCLSIREVIHATQLKIDDLKQRDAVNAAWQIKGLRAFMSRLHWHCHFIQKLESEPEIEFENMHRGYDGLRETEWKEANFLALTEGRTGWPMVDACVAMLKETGWINFRMRAMLVSVASYALWLHWRKVGLWLAKLFIDYEPGIHWSQMQMQAGTTGMNATRVYNPIKQAQDHDPHGYFVRKWLPYMRQVPDSWLFEPWRMPAELQNRYGVIVGSDIPVPIVDFEVATKAAKQRMHSRRKQPDVAAQKQIVVEKHGSRVFRGNQKTKTPKDEPPIQQMLAFD